MTIQMMTMMTSPYYYSSTVKLLILHLATPGTSREFDAKVVIRPLDVPWQEEDHHPNNPE